MASSEHPTGNSHTQVFTAKNQHSTFRCDCGQEYDDQVALDEHKRTKCEHIGVFCPLCDEHFSTSETMGFHLMLCGNKTTKCPNCRKYVRRGIYIYHMDNNCINLDDNETNMSNFDMPNSLVDQQHNPLDNINTQRPKSYDESLDRMDTAVERIRLPSETELTNTSANHTKQTKESAVGSLRGKASQVQESLCTTYYPTEVNHVAEKLQFNIILMGSPRVGKSQLINAICNGENKAQTSSSLNSCTKDVSCYYLEDDQQETSGVKPFRVNFYDTPGIESWTNEDGRTTMLKFIEEKDPLCVIFCAAPGTFADLKQVRPVLEYCQNRKIFWAFVCTNMWSSAARKEVVNEFEKELIRLFGDRIEKSFDQPHSPIPHKVTVFGSDALCTMVNSIEYYDPEYSSERKPVQGVDELIYCIMESLDNEKLLGWCSAVLFRRTFWEKFTQKVTGFASLRINDIQNMNDGSIQKTANDWLIYISKKIGKS